MHSIRMIRGRRRAITLAVALSLALGAGYSVPDGRADGGEEAADRRRLHEVAQHRRAGDLR